MSLFDFDIVGVLRDVVIYIVKTVPVYDGKLLKEQRQTWQYLKGVKKLSRKAVNGYEYIFSEGTIPMIDTYDKPARTMLTSEGSFSRTTHIVKNKATGRIRLLTAEETERIQGFPTGHTVLYGWR